MVDTVEKAIYHLSVTGVDQLDRAAQGVDKLAASEDKLKAANDRLAASGEKVVVIDQRDEVAKRTATGGIDRLIASMDRQMRAEQQLARTRAQLTRYEQEGTASGAQLSRANELVVQRYEQQIAAINKTKAAHNDNNAATGHATVSTNQLRYAQQNLLFQLNDIGTSLASGGSPFRVIAQQIGQVQQAISQGGGIGPVLGGVASSLTAMVTPARAAVAGIAALGVGIGVLVARASDAAQSMRVFNALLSGTATSGLTDAAGLEAAAKRLRDVGLSAAEARKEILSVGRAGVNPGAAEAVVRTGRNLDAVFGEGQTRALTAALAGGIDTAVKYGLAVKGISAPLANAALEMARLGKPAEALDLVFQSISRHADGLREKSMSPLALATEKMAVKWNELLDKLANSRPILALVEALTKLIDGLDRLAQFKPPSWLTTMLGAVVPGVGAGGGFLIGRAIEAAGNIAAANQPLATAAVPPLAVGRGSGAGIVGEAASQLGLNESRDRSAIASYLASGGANLDPATVAWCAAFANAVLARQGMSGTGSNVANSFLNWGSAVSGDALPGDVIVLLKGRGAGQTGGHVGFATGETQLTDRGLMLGMISGNRGNAVTQDWVNANEATLRRGATAASVSTGDTTTAVQHAQQYALAQQRLADATKGVGFEQDKLRIATEVLQDAQFNGLTTADKTRLVLDLTTAARTRLANEIENTAAATAREIEGTRAVADAYAQTTKEGKIQEAVVKAEGEAFRLFGQISGEAAQKFIASRSQETIALETQSEKLRSNQDLLTQRDNQDVLKLQLGLVGQTTEEISKQVALLTEKQRIEREFPFLTEQEKNNRLASVAATADMTAKLSEANRQQQRLEEGVRLIASTINNELTRSIESAFSGAKAEDWGVRIRRMLGGLAAQISDAFFIKPLLGQPLSVLPAGTFGELQFEENE